MTEAGSERHAPRPALLGVCASAKPPPGAAAKSAVRGYLMHMLDQVQTLCPSALLLDLRDRPLPWFDGRTPEAHDDENVSSAFQLVEAAGALLLAVPAYWSTVGAVFKNFCEVLSGPAYDLENRPTVFAGKPCGLLIVGADLPSALRGGRHAEEIMMALGATLVAPPVIISNPREQRSARELSDLAASLGEVAAAAALAGCRAIAAEAAAR